MNCELTQCTSLLKIKKKTFQIPKKLASSASLYLHGSRWRYLMSQDTSPLRVSAFRRPYTYSGAMLPFIYARYSDIIS